MKRSGKGKGEGKGGAASPGLRPKKNELGRLWWEAGVAAGKTHFPDAETTKWEDMPDTDKAFMQAAAENFRALVIAAFAAKPSRSKGNPSATPRTRRAGK